MREPSNIQRLWRERDLGRYIAALERGDLDTLSLLLQRAEKDPLLQLMILEVHESYQDEDLFLRTVDENEDMDTKTGTSRSFPENETTAQEAFHLARRRRNTWLRALAAVILVCLLGGGFLGIQLWRTSQTASGGRTHASSSRLANGWCAVNSPALNPVDTRPDLAGVSGDAPGDVWAVGSNNNGTQQVIEHWNGQNWQLSAPPDIPGKDTSLSAIQALAPNDVWAAGSWVFADQNNQTAGIHSRAIDGLFTDSHADVLNPQAALSGNPGQTHPLIEHWNGENWSVLPVPEPANSAYSALTAIAAISANDAWAIGSAFQASRMSAALIEHWDGSKWSIATDPAFQQGGMLTAITAISANDIWVSGGVSAVQGYTGAPQNLLAYTLPRATPTSYFLHWNGSQWQIVSNPGPAANVSSLSALSANNIWAAGSDSTGQAITEHWNGTNWTVIHNPAATPGQATSATVTFASILALAANDVWVAGEATDEQSNLSYQVVEHWNGQQWQALPANHNDDFGQLNSITGVAGKIWAVGTTYATYQQILQLLIETSC